MQLGVQFADFTGTAGPALLGATLAQIARDADQAGFDQLSVIDHLWQIPQVGPTENEMLEAYTTLGFLAAHTSTITLHTLVTSVTYRELGLLAKIVTTLDVRSGGRAMLGIGAAWNGDEAPGLGLPFPPTTERFERIEETIQIILQMWQPGEASYHGKHYQLARTLNSPQPLATPRPKIMIGGSGEKKTLRLVAQYADACNISRPVDLSRKLDVLRAHCADVGRDCDTIQKTAVMSFELGPKGEGVGPMLERLRELHELGFTVATGSLRGPDAPSTVAAYGEHILPVIAEW